MKKSISNLFFKLIKCSLNTIEFHSMKSPIFIIEHNSKNSKNKIIDTLTISLLFTIYEKCHTAPILRDDISRNRTSICQKNKPFSHVSD